MNGKRLGWVPVVLALMGIAPNVRSERPWYASYEEALARLEKGDARGAVPLLQRALRDGPDPGPNRPTYGMQFMDFFPYLHLARAYLLLGDCAQARDALNLSVRQDRLPEDRVKTELLPLQQKLQTLCATPSPAPGTLTESPPGPKVPPSPASSVEPRPVPPGGPADGRRRVPVAALQKAWEAYLRGDYVVAQRVLETARREYELDDVAAFILGCSIAARYFREGERDVRLREAAREYLRRARDLPPGLRQNLRLFISPKVLALYERER